MTLVTVGPNTQAAAQGSSLTQSHNYLPSKIGSGIFAGKNGGTPQTAQKQGVARLYSSTALARDHSSSQHGRDSSMPANGMGPSAPKISSAKSPGKTFKQKPGCTGQLTTIAGSGVRKQQTLK